jgi:hypothetical protein
MLRKDRARIGNQKQECCGYAYCIGRNIVILNWLRLLWEAD